MPVGAAIGGGALVGAGATIYSGNKAAGAVNQGAQQSADIQRYMYDTSRADTAPYRQVGESALNQLASLYGLPQYQAPAANDSVAPRSLQTGPANPESSTPQQYAPDYTAFMNSPDYQFAYGEGNRAVEQNLARQGLTGSGAALKALTRFGQGMASQQLGNYKNSLAALAGVGQTSTAQIGSLGAATGQGIGRDMRATGDARASSYLNTGAAVSGLANTGSQLALLGAGGFGGAGTATPPPPSYVNWNQGIV